MALTKQEIKKIARLARINLTSAEEHRHAETISAVLDYMKILNEVDTRAVEATAQVTGLNNVVRDDMAIKCPATKDLLEQMPETRGGQLSVPCIFE